MAGISKAEQARRAASKRWGERNKEKLNKMYKKYRDSHKEEYKEWNKKHTKPYSEFTEEKKKKRQSVAKDRINKILAESDESAKRYVLDRLIISSRSRAKERGMEHNLEKGDLYIPDCCPVLNVRMYTQRSMNEEMTVAKLNHSPQLDRIDPNKGYIHGNVIVVSAKANRIKSNATPEEILLVAEFYQNLER
jgi:hypothetical protein